MYCRNNEASCREPGSQGIVKKLKGTPPDQSRFWSLSRGVRACMHAGYHRVGAPADNVGGSRRIGQPSQAFESLVPRPMGLIVGLHYQLTQYTINIMKLFK